MEMADKRECVGDFWNAVDFGEVTPIRFSLRKVSLYPDNIETQNLTMRYMREKVINKVSIPVDDNMLSFKS